MPTDRFVYSQLPPRSEWPVFLTLGHEPQPEHAFNLVDQLLQGSLQQPWADRPLFRSSSHTWTYREVIALVNQRVRVLVHDLQLQPGNRVLIRGGNSMGFALAWLAVVKAGLIAVATMPMLRAKELGDVISQAQPVLALCDQRLLDELLIAQSQYPVLKQVMCFNQTDDTDSLELRSASHSADDLPIVTFADDIALLAFTSGTTGKPKAACHSHRQVWAACQAWPTQVLQARSDDLVIGTPPLAFTFGLGGLLLFPMVAGASVFFPEGTLTAERMVEVMAQAKCTVCYTAPTFYVPVKPCLWSPVACGLNTRASSCWTA